MWLYRVNHAIAPLLGLYWRLELRGRVEAIPPEGPLIVAPNHASFLDPWFLGMAFPRPIRYLVAEVWYRRNAAFTNVLRAFGTVPVRVGDPHSTLEVVCEHLDRGEVFGMFPEGKVSADGVLQEFRSGLPRVAAKSGAPVLPVGIRGNHASFPRSGRFPRPSKVKVHVGEPLVFEGSPMERKPNGAQVRAFNAELRERILELQGP